MPFIRWFRDSISRTRQANIRTLCTVFIIDVVVFILFYSRAVGRSSIESAPCYVLTLPGHDQRANDVIRLFKKYANLDLRPFYGVNGNILYRFSSGHRLKPGERGLRDSMKNLFRMATEKNHNEMFIFEDDAVPHRNFTQLFQQLPSRCREADILLLGATIDAAKEDYWPTVPCFDAHNRTYGAFGLLVKKSAFGPILSWLAEAPSSPFDTVYGHLQKQKIIVRVAYPPFLVIADISHPSTVNRFRIIDRMNRTERAKLHRWKLDEYPLSEMSAKIRGIGLPPKRG